MCYTYIHNTERIDREKNKIDYPFTTGIGNYISELSVCSLHIVSLVEVAVVLRVNLLICNIHG